LFLKKMLSILTEDKPAAVQAETLRSVGVAGEEAVKPTSVLLLNIAWMLVGNVLYGLSQWAQLMALAKLGTIEMVGTFALALAVCLPVLMFSSLSLRSLQVTDYKRSHRFIEYVALRLVTLVFSLLFIVLFEVVAGNGAAIVTATALIGAAKAVEYISDILYGSLQQQEDMSGIAISMTLRAILSVSSLSLGVYFTHSLAWGATCMLVSSALVLLGYDVPKAMRVGNINLRTLSRELGKYSREVIGEGGHKRLSKLTMAGLPMGFVLMMVSLNLNIPRYFIQQRLGTHELAIFSAIATLLTAGSVVTNAMGQAAAPRLAKCFVNGDRRGFIALLAALVVASLGLGAAGFAVSVLFGKQAMALMYRPEYTTRQDVLVWLMGASGFFYLGSALGYAVTAVRCFTPQLPLFAGAAVTTAIACMILVPSQGLRGVAIAILISAVIQCAGSARLLWTSCKRSNSDPLPVAG
jgi:O-antigen/teichoic acid export membrane protein